LNKDFCQKGNMGTKRMWAWTYLWLREIILMQKMWVVRILGRGLCRRFYNNYNEWFERITSERKLL